MAKKMGANMKSELVEKQYIARVSGIFPRYSSLFLTPHPYLSLCYPFSDTVVSKASIGPWPGRRGLQRESEDGKSAHTTFKRIHLFPDNTSLILCIPQLGHLFQAVLWHFSSKLSSIVFESLVIFFIFYF